MEPATILLPLSIIAQCTAAILALRLIRISGGSRAWLAISAGIILVIMRRCVIEYDVIFQDR